MIIHEIPLFERMTKIDDDQTSMEKRGSFHKQREPWFRCFIGVTPKNASRITIEVRPIFSSGLLLQVDIVRCGPEAKLIAKQR